MLCNRCVDHMHTLFIVVGHKAYMYLHVPDECLFQLCNLFQLEVHHCQCTIVFHLLGIVFDALDCCQVNITLKHLQMAIQLLLVPSCIQPLSTLHIGSLPVEQRNRDMATNMIFLQWTSAACSLHLHFTRCW